MTTAMIFSDPFHVSSVLFHSSGWLTSGLASPYDPPPLNSPVFLHLVHPYALKNFKTAIGNVHRFRNYLRSLTAGGENAQIARDVLLDLVDCCGVDLEALGSLLESVAEDVKSLPGALR